MTDGDTKALQGQIDSLKAELALRSESAEKLCNSKNESMDKRLSYHIKYINIVHISLASFIAIVTICLTVFSVSYIKRKANLYADKSAQKAVKDVVDRYEVNLVERIDSMEKDIKFNYWYSQGTSEYSNNNKSPIVIDFMQKALLFASDNASASYAHNHIGGVYGKMGDYNHALEEYDESIKLKSDNPLSFINRAKIHSLLNHKDEAQKDLDMARILIKEDKDERSKAFHNKVIEKYKLKEWEEAMKKEEGITK